MAPATLCGAWCCAPQRVHFDTHGIGVVEPLVTRPLHGRRMFDRKRLVMGLYTARNAARQEMTNVILTQVIKWLSTGGLDELYVAPFWANEFVTWLCRFGSPLPNVRRDVTWRLCHRFVPKRPLTP